MVPWLPIWKTELGLKTYSEEVNTMPLKSQNKIIVMKFTLPSLRSTSDKKWDPASSTESIFPNTRVANGSSCGRKVESVWRFRSDSWEESQLEAVVDCQCISPREPTLVNLMTKETRECVRWLSVDSFSYICLCLLLLSFCIYVYVQGRVQLASFSRF